MALSWEYERKYGKHRVNPTSFLPNNHDADVAKFSKKLVQKYFQNQNWTRMLLPKNELLQEKKIVEVKVF